MKLQIVVLDLELHTRTKRLLATATGLVITIALASVAVAQVPNTFAPGDVLTSAALNENFSALDEGVAALEATNSSLETRLAALEAEVGTARSRVAVDNVAPFNLPSGVYAAIPYSTVAYDDLVEFDPVTSTFVPEQAGDYLVCAAITMDNANVAYTELYTYVNDTRDKAFGGPYTDYAMGCRAVRLVAGDELQVRVRQSSGSTLDVPSNAYFSWLTISSLD